MKTKTYKIVQSHDEGDRGIYIESAFDPSYVLSYIQKKAAELLTNEVTLSNFALASVLINLYHCKSAARIDDAVIVNATLCEVTRNTCLKEIELKFENSTHKKPNSQILKALIPHLDDMD